MKGTIAFRFAMARDVALNVNIGLLSLAALDSSGIRSQTQDEK